MMRSDWYSADIIAALKKQEVSLSAVPRNSGRASSTLTEGRKVNRWKARCGT